MNECMIDWMNKWLCPYSYHEEKRHYFACSDCLGMILLFLWDVMALFYVQYEYPWIILYLCDVYICEWNEGKQKKRNESFCFFLSELTGIWFLQMIKRERKIVIFGKHICMYLVGEERIRMERTNHIRNIVMLWNWKLRVET